MTEGSAVDNASGGAPPASAPTAQTSTTASREVGSVVDYLTRTGNMYKRHIELLQRQKEAQEREEATFKPTVTPYAEAAAKRSTQRQSETIEERLHHLHEKKLERERQLRERQQAAEEAALNALTFEPNITRRAAALDRSRSGDTGNADISVTLTKWQQERDAKVARMQAQLAHEELSHLQDRPRITAYAQHVAARERPQDVSIEDYLLLQEEKRRRRQYALTEMHWSCLDEGHNGQPADGASDGGWHDRSVSARSLTQGTAPSAAASSPRQWFSPAISSRAARLHRPGDVTERLYRSPLEQSRAEDLYDEVYETHCTFKPALSSFSRQLSHSRYTDPAIRSKPIYERLYENPAAPPRHRQRPVPTPAEEEAARHPHHPQISETSRLLVEAQRQRHPTGAESPGTRLHRAALQGRASAKRTTYKKPVITPKEREAMEELTFKPKVSARSEELWERKVAMLVRDGHARNEAEARTLLWRQAQKKAEGDLRRRKAVEEAGEMLECTFQPRSGRPPVGKFGYDPDHGLSVAERSQLWSQQKARRLELLKAELEMEEAEEVEADCTFQPQVHEAYPLPRRTKPTEAEEAFVRRQEEARKRRTEAERWWQPKANAAGREKGNSRSTSAAPTPRPRRPPTTTALDTFKFGSERKTLAPQRARSAQPSPASTRRHTRANEDDEDDEDEAEERFEPHYTHAPPLPPRHSIDAHDFVPRHHQPQQPHPMSARVAAVRGEPQSLSSAPYRPVPATRDAEWRKPSPLDAYRSDM